MILLLLLLLLCGCREERRYAYEFLKMDVAEGELNIHVIGNYGPNYETDGKKLLDWGFPYNIQFIYLAPASSQATRLEITNIQLTGRETGVTKILEDIETDQPRIYGETKLLRVSAGPLTADAYTYQDYTLEARVTLYADSLSPQTIDISLDINKDYSQGSRSDWFDEQSSI